MRLTSLSVLCLVLCALQLEACSWLMSEPLPYPEAQPEADMMPPAPPPIIPEVVAGAEPNIPPSPAGETAPVAGSQGVAGVMSGAEAGEPGTGGVIEAGVEAGAEAGAEAGVEAGAEGATEASAGAEMGGVTGGLAGGLPVAATEGM